MNANNTMSGPQSMTHKDYIKNMLLQKFTKKYQGNAKGQLDFHTTQIINNEVLNFIKNEKMNRENLKLLESKIDLKLQNKNNNVAQSVDGKAIRYSS